MAPRTVRDGTTAGRDRDNHPTGLRVSAFELTKLPGVMEVETFRAAPVEILFCARTRQQAILGHGRVSRRTVQVGDPNEQSTQILGGLAEGDVVVVYPEGSRTEGAKVTMR